MTNAAIKLVNAINRADITAAEVKAADAMLSARKGTWMGEK